MVEGQSINSELPALNITDTSLQTSEVRPEYSYQTLEEAVACVTAIEIDQNDPDYDSADKQFVPMLHGQELGYVNSNELTPLQREFLNRSVSLVSADYVKNKKWWLDEYWQEKLGQGKLTEQIRFSFKDSHIDIYNFQDSFSKKDIERLKAVYSRLYGLLGKDLAKISPPVIFNVGEKVMGPLGKEEECSGAVDKFDNVMVITEAAFRSVLTEKAYQRGAPNGMESRLQEVISHEYGHMLARVDFNLNRLNTLVEKEWKEWIEIGEWYRDEYCNWKARGDCPTTNAYVNPSEDFAESFMLYLWSPGMLDKVRKDYLDKYYFGEKAEKKPAEIMCQRMNGKEIDLPKTKPITRKYKIELYNEGQNPEEFMKQVIEDCNSSK